MTALNKRLPLLGGLILAALLIISAALPGIRARAAWQSKVDPRLLAHAEAGPVEVLISLSEQADLSAARGLPTKAEKGAYVYQKLSEVAARTQPALLAALQARGVEYRTFWIANLVWARLDKASMEQIALRPDVARIYANPTVRVDLPPPPAVQPVSAAEGVEWNIARVRAPEVWAAGYLGQGAVVAGQDTGYQWDHPALLRQYRGWDGQTADHSYNWHDAIHSGESACPPDSPAPCDDHGHGTHTMGTMVGDDGLGNQIGMAPEARWIGCRNMINGVGTPTTYTECFEWFAAPTDLAGANPRPDLAPDVINNSWTCPPGEGCSWDALQTVVENTRAAGILVVASAGNAGYSGCETVNDPPALYGAAFTVGATTSADDLASFSSRGPADYNGLMKPDISAPGEGIRSSVPGGYGGLSGTSMAGPHVAGLAALLVSRDPGLRGQVDQLEQLMRYSALRFPPPVPCSEPVEGQIPNNSYGWGRIDAWLAITVQQLYWPLILN